MVASAPAPRRRAARAVLTLRQRAALARLLRLPGVVPADLAQALGIARREAVRRFREAGLDCVRAAPRRATAPAVPPPAALDAALRAHVARQIAALDAHLAQGPATVDSARILRDLGGLRRLLDETTHPAADGASDAGPAHDLVRRRARLARRLAATTPAALAARLSRRPAAARSGEPGA